MEKIDKILEDPQNQEKTNTSTWKKPTKFKNTCVVCGKVFEFEVIPKNRFEYPYGAPSFCSDKCKMIYKNKEYQKRLTIIPIKFRDIECDKPKIIKQGIEQSMFITGAVGVGKTVLMAGIAKEILKAKERKVEWVSYPDFIMELQSSFRKDDEVSPYEMAEEIASFWGTLCIDDLGAEKMTAFVQQITYYIINYREQGMLHTLITSNFSLQQIDEQDRKVSSRIGGMCKIIKLTGKDRRLEKSG